ncbi:MAG: alpha/beta fold hydrolase [Acidobacteriaceae bacterium]|nr:alpha/beta fold hydrolase [Acidobacteriaceae bacterium]
MTKVTTINPEPFPSDVVHGFLHRPEPDSGDGVVLSHGAGSNCNAPLLIAVAEAFSLAGLTALRCNLPFRDNRPFGPPLPASAAQDREGLRQALNELRRIVPGKLFLGGHSYGGRQASILAAEDPDVCSGLVLLSYPLHPPKKPQHMRTEHFPKLRTPALFAHGSNDPFGSIEEVREALSLIRSEHTLRVISNAGHDLLRGRLDIAGEIVEPFLTLVKRSAQAQP